MLDRGPNIKSTFISRNGAFWWMGCSLIIYCRSNEFCIAHAWSQRECRVAWKLFQRLFHLNSGIKGMSKQFTHVLGSTLFCDVVKEPMGFHRDSMFLQVLQDDNFAAVYSKHCPLMVKTAKKQVKRKLNILWWFKIYWMAPRGRNNEYL